MVSFNLRNGLCMVSSIPKGAMHYTHCCHFVIFFSLQGVGKDILIDKFWLVLLVIERLDNMYDF